MTLFSYYYKKWNCLLLILLVQHYQIFCSNSFHFLHRHHHQQQRRFVTTTALFTTTATNMKVSDIKNELREMNIDFSDCFDKESLIQRLQDAKINNNNGSIVDNNDSEEPKQQEEKVKMTDDTTTTTIINDINDQDLQLLDEIRLMSVKELRTELAEQSIRWSGLLEKEDLVQAVYKARQDARNFSVTGLLKPGTVTELISDDIQKEINNDLETPILVDVYATWCGPCKMVSEQLNQLAAEMPTIKFIKMDTEKNRSISGEWRIHGLPSLLLFYNGKELSRLEGGYPKEQIKIWMNEKIFEYDTLLQKVKKINKNNKQ